MATHLRMRSATPSVYFDLEKGVLTMIEQNDCQEDCGCKSYSSDDFKQEGTSAYNYNVHAHLPVTPAQLMRPGIGRNASCAVGDFA